MNNSVENEFIDIVSMINRDVENEVSKKNKIYQVQSDKNKNTINLVYLGKYDSVPIKNILSINHPKYENIKCDMMSYTLSKEEINNSSKYLKMIGFLLSIDNNIIASVDYVFCPNKQIKLGKKKMINQITTTDNNIKESLNSNLNKNSQIFGSFKIVLFKKENTHNIEIIIKEYTEYIGREESIYILTSVLLEENVIEKYIER